MSAPLLLSIPDELSPLLLKSATRDKCTVQAVILEIVARHYHIEVTVPKRGRPPEKPQQKNLSRKT